MNSQDRCSQLGQTDEDAYYLAISGYLLAMECTRTILPEAQSEALGRAVLRHSRFLTQDMLLDPATSAEIVREFIREWVKK